MHHLSRKKVVIVGDSGVGKSNIILRFTQQKFGDDIAHTIGISLINKTVQVDGNDVELEIADTAGQERYRTLTSSYYRYVDTVIIVYDVTSRTSFESLQWWLGEVETHSPVNVQIVIVAHKIDNVEQRVVSKQEGEAFAKLYTLQHFECSAKENLNIDPLFTYAVKKAIENQNILTQQVSVRRANSKPRKKTNSEKFFKNLVQIISPRS